MSVNRLTLYRSPTSDQRVTSSISTRMGHLSTGFDMNVLGHYVQQHIHKAHLHKIPSCAPKLHLGSQKKCSCFRNRRYIATVGNTIQTMLREGGKKKKVGRVKLKVRSKGLAVCMQLTIRQGAWFPILSVIYCRKLQSCSLNWSEPRRLHMK